MLEFLVLDSWRGVEWLNGGLKNQLKEGGEIQPPILARPPQVSKLSASQHRCMKSLSNHISYNKKIIAQ